MWLSEPQFFVVLFIIIVILLYSFTENNKRVVRRSKEESISNRILGSIRNGKEASGSVRKHQ